MIMARTFQPRRLDLTVFCVAIVLAINTLLSYDNLHDYFREQQHYANTSTSSNLSQAQKLVLEGSSTIFEVLPQTTNQSSAVSPVGDLLRIYVYENLPKKIGKDVEDFLYDRFRQSRPIVTCELPWIMLFRSFPGRTWNPDEADLFVVPYAHGGHCEYYEGWETQCRHVPTVLTRRVLFSSMPYYLGNETRHLFLVSSGREVVHFRLLKKPLVLSYGPLVGDPPPPGHLISTIFNDMPHYQPSVLLSRSEDWWTRPRRYSFVCFSGESNPRMKTSGRRFRRYFHEDIEAQVGSGSKGMLAGLPYHFEPISGGHGSNATKAYDLYSNSVFCPVLPGDAGWQRRFFDVILSGCIPVMLSWDIDDEKGQKSWFVPEVNQSIQHTYPFAKKAFGGDETIEIDYDSMVAECQGNRDKESDVSCLRRTMEDMLLHRPNEIRKKQLQLKRYALAFSLGLGEDAHKYEDGFARTIRVLKRYYDHHVRLQQRAHQPRLT